jgi:hypothetical protein
VQVFTREQFDTYVAEGYGVTAESVMGTVARWLARGDGVAIYENADLSSPDLGVRQMVSYGSESAQLEDAVPPERMPDIGANINWRFRLVGIYGGPAGTAVSRDDYMVHRPEESP